jgi:hypothetical protein
MDQIYNLLIILNSLFYNLYIILYNEREIKSVETWYI